MYPAAKDGDLVVFYRLDKDYEARDLIVLEVGGAKEVRRVVAVAGDKVDFENGMLVINGIPRREPGIYEKSEQFLKGIEFPIQVPEGKVFVLGDARENSKDSRIYGTVDIKNTYGTVIMIVRRREF